MQQVEQQPKNPWPVMITVAQRSIPLDHVLKVDTTALESHKTILVHTTTGAEMFHDDVALDVARAFGLRPAAEKKEAGREPAPPKRRKG